MNVYLVEISDPTGNHASYFIEMELDAEMYPHFTEERNMFFGTDVFFGTWGMVNDHSDREPFMLLRAPQGGKFDFGSEYEHWQRFHYWDGMSSNPLKVGNGVVIREEKEDGSFIHHRLRIARIAPV